MICIFLSVIATALISFAVGLLFFAFLMIQPVAGFVFTQIPIAKLATVETFLEIGLLIYLLLTKLFGQRRRNRNIVSFIGLLVIMALVIIAMYYSFSSPVLLLTSDIPVVSDLYMVIFKFFDNVVGHIEGFFLG